MGDNRPRSGYGHRLIYLNAHIGRLRAAGTSRFLGRERRGQERGQWLGRPKYDSRPSRLAQRDHRHESAWLPQAESHAVAIHTLSPLTQRARVAIAAPPGRAPLFRGRDCKAATSYP